MGLVYSGRTQGPLLALESQQRVGDGSRDPWLERVPDHLRSGGVLAAPSRRSPGVPPRVCLWTRFRERQGVLRHRASIGAALRRPAVLRSLLLLRTGSAWFEG